MTTLEAFLLGVLQGLTEFLPVSSSGHLVLAEMFFGLDGDQKSLLGFDVFLHAGSLLALVLVYAGTWEDIIVRNWRLLGLLFFATVPVGITGVFFDNVIAESLHSVGPVSVMLGVTGIVLIVGERASRRPAPFSLNGAGRLSMTPCIAFVVGVAQALALIPGLSRSGLTISVGRMCGVSRKEALDFSFLLAVPAIGGAALLTGLNVLKGDVVFPPIVVSMAGFLSSFGFSIFTIVFLKRWVVTKSFHVFAWYVILLSILVFIAHSAL